MIGTILIPRDGRGFAVAHRFEDGEHRFEVSVGSSFNELYWDETAKELASPRRHRELRKVMADHGAGWLLEYMPKLSSDNAHVTSTDLVQLASLQR